MIKEVWASFDENNFHVPEYKQRDNFFFKSLEIKYYNNKFFGYADVDAFLFTCSRPM